MLNKYVDVFYGSGEIDHPIPEGIAATWYFIKAQCGNTHPHAALPFGKITPRVTATMSRILAVPF